MRLVCILIRSFLKDKVQKVTLDKYQCNNLLRNYCIPLEKEWVSYPGLVFLRFFTIYRS